MSPPSLDKENPYAAPVSNLNQNGNDNQAGFDPGGKSVGTDKVMGWYGRAFEMFKTNAGMWILMIIVFMILNMVLAFIPLVNLAMHILFPVFAGGFMLGCMAIDRGEALRIEHIFEGFQKNFSSLALVGLLYLAALFAIGVVVAIAMLVVGLGGIGAMMAGGGSSLAGTLLAGGMGVGFLLIFLVAMALMIPVAMAIWFAPLLVVAHQMTPIDAMKASFSGCIKNILPFLLYGILYIVFAIVACIPLMLGWLVLGPVLIASVYTSYQDIYLTRN
ncbi:MAG: hypothetical protein RL748_1914 [Pseudomonadota bacterium]|jgi:uncharacterized membrane protein